MTAEGVHEETVGGIPSPEERVTGRQGLERVREALDRATPAPTEKPAREGDDDEEMT